MHYQSTAGAESPFSSGTSSLSSQWTRKSVLWPYVLLGTAPVFFLSRLENHYLELQQQKQMRYTCTKAFPTLPGSTVRITSPCGTVQRGTVVGVRERQAQGVLRLL